jgi:hypothetical protein
MTSVPFSLALLSFVTQILMKSCWDLKFHKVPVPKPPWLCIDPLQKVKMVPGVVWAGNWVLIHLLWSILCISFPMSLPRPQALLSSFFLPGCLHPWHLMTSESKRHSLFPQVQFPCRFAQDHPATCDLVKSQKRN